MQVSDTNIPKIFFIDLIGQSERGKLLITAITT